MPTACAHGCSTLPVYTLPCAMMVSATGTGADANSTVSDRARATMIEARIRRVVTSSPLERGRCIDPQQPRLRPARIAPTMWRGAFEIKTIARLQAIVFVIAQPDFKGPAENVKEFLALMGIGFAAAALRLYTEKMRLHHRVPPSQQFHADSGIGLENFSLLGPHKAAILAGSLEQRQNIGAIKLGDTPQRGHRRTHLPALQRTEKADGHPRGASYLRERQTAAHTQAAKALARKVGSFSGQSNGALTLQHMHNRRRVQSARAAEEQRAL